ncbi:MAG TPA: GntR family transcriptional regulator [Armatimonadetes bacterium]|jgi:GntR family transcriptional regulator|nr:GntR family transcriptional regulator [Armatimonadota bacterium]
MRISVDPRSGTPLYLQIKEQMRMAVATGALRPGEKLPTVRDLATELRINFNTVVRAYREMQAEGLLSSRQGSGTFVSESAGEVGQEEARRVVRRMIREAIRTARNAGLSQAEIADMMVRALDGEGQEEQQQRGGTARPDDDGV